MHQVLIKWSSPRWSQNNQNPRCGLRVASGHQGRHMSKIHFLGKILEQVPVVIASAMMFLLMALTFADVILRSVFNLPIEAATELIRMLMAMIVFSILPVVSARNAHIEVDLLDSVLFRNARIKRARDSLVALACGLILILPARQAVVLAERARSYGDVTEYLAIPQFYIGWFIALMTWITAFTLILRAIVLFYKTLAPEPNSV